VIKDFASLWNHTPLMTTYIDVSANWLKNIIWMVKNLKKTIVEFFHIQMDISEASQSNSHCTSYSLPIVLLNA
jgi:hypothetical protein